MMTSHPSILAPRSPVELLSYILSHHSQPTAVLVGSSKTVFVSSIISEIHAGQTGHAEADRQQPPSPSLAQQLNHHPLLYPSLQQIASSRNISFCFIPTVTHLRAYLSTFSASNHSGDGRPSSNVLLGPPSGNKTAALLVYGFLDLHRGGSEWSAQGLGDSAAALVEAGARHRLLPVIAEPPNADGQALDDILAEKVPLLNESSTGDGARWREFVVDVGRVLRRWFDVSD